MACLRFTDLQSRPMEFLDLTSLRSTTRIRLIHIGGHLRGNPWCGPHHSVRPVVNNVRGERGLALGLNNLCGPFIRPGHTSGPPHDWQ